jgi:hypothetical protein
MNTHNQQPPARRHTAGFAILLMAAAFVFWLTTQNSGQPAAIETAGDIAAWENAVFVLSGRTLTKLNEKLEVVKSIPLPVEPLPVPPSPVPDPPAIEEPEISNRAFPLAASSSASVCADQQSVYVLYEGILFAFDHDLNYRASKPFDVSR